MYAYTNVEVVRRERHKKVLVDYRWYKWVIVVENVGRTVVAVG